MIKFQINNQEVEVEPGTKLITVARERGITVPTMCYLEEYPHFTSCMLCVFKEVKTGKLLASCSVPAEDGMIIETDSDDVVKARKSALELLMSDHVGDCQAPCERTCPAHMNIALMNFQIENGQYREGLITVKEHIALPAVLGRICSAPCENACRRNLIGESLSICALKCFVADQDLASDSPYIPECAPPTGKRVAIIGSGPAGLSAAYYLQQFGHACTIFDANLEAGGALRYGTPESELPRHILDGEIDVIRRLGANFELNHAIDFNDFLEIQNEFDAVILATGETSLEQLKQLEIESGPKGVRVDKTTFQSSMDGVFAGGGVTHSGKMAVRSVSHGRSMALSVNNYLLDQGELTNGTRSQSRIAKVNKDQFAQFAQVIDQIKDSAQTKQNANGNPLNFLQANDESGRCLQCGCVSFNGCQLRLFSEQYGANPQRFKGETRKSMARVYDHPYVVYEPGKCIQCGLCVRITEKEGEGLGLTFIGRGFDVQVDVPLNQPLEKGLEKAAQKCVEACPSGALVFREKLLPIIK